MVVKAELFKEELKIEAKTKNGFSSEESTNCQFGSSNCQQVPSSSFPLCEPEMNSTEIYLLNTAKFSKWIYSFGPLGSQCSNVNVFNFVSVLTVSLGDWLEKRKVTSIIIKQQFGFPIGTTLVLSFMKFDWELFE